MINFAKLCAYIDIIICFLYSDICYYEIMNIKFGEYLSNIENIIESKSKYQKVMLLYDDNISNLEITEIYDFIKEKCIFNKLNIIEDKDKLNEVFNGYRTIIFYCSINSLFNLDFDKSEFINIYLPIENAILPYYLDNSYKIKKNNNDYLILKNKFVDISLIFSTFFNKFYNYLKNLIYVQNYDNDLNFNFNELSSMNSIDLINSIERDFEFIDIQVIKQCQIEYQYLPIVDYLIITAFSLVIKSIHNHTLSMVDIYKSVKEDYALMDKFYAMTNNEWFANIINLNFNCINTLCEKCREAILDRLSICEEFNESIVIKIINKIKDYFKYSQGIFAYLYLYNIFGL